MWVCQKCSREFQRTNQAHYCGKAPENAGEYIEAQSEIARPHLAALRSMILSVVPEAREWIAWSMPTYEKDKKRVSFAACKYHVSLYVDSALVERFRAQLSAFTIKKNVVYLPYTSALPKAIIEDMLKSYFGVDWSSCRLMEPKKSE